MSQRVNLFTPVGSVSIKSRYQLMGGLSCSRLSDSRDRENRTRSFSNSLFLPSRSVEQAMGGPFFRGYLFSLGQANSCHSIPVYPVRTCVSSDAEIFHYRWGTTVGFNEAVSPGFYSRLVKSLLKL